MRTLMMAMAMAGMIVQAAAPAQAQAQAENGPVLYEYNGKSYRTEAECLRAKKRAKARGTVAGAAVAGLGAALLGGNVGETALVAGAGALVGRELGRRSNKQC